MLILIPASLLSKFYPKSKDFSGRMKLHPLWLSKLTSFILSHITCYLHLITIIGHKLPKGRNGSHLCLSPDPTLVTTLNLLSSFRIEQGFSHYLLTWWQWRQNHIPRHLRHYKCRNLYQLPQVPGSVRNHLAAEESWSNRNKCRPGQAADFFCNGHGKAGRNPRGY